MPTQMTAHESVRFLLVCTRKAGRGRSRELLQIESPDEQKRDRRSLLVILSERSESKDLRTCRLHRRFRQRRSFDFGLCPSLRMTDFQYGGSIVSILIVVIGRRLVICETANNRAIRESPLRGKTGAIRRNAEGTLVRTAERSMPVPYMRWKRTPPGWAAFVIWWHPRFSGGCPFSVHPGGR